MHTPEIRQLLIEAQSEIRSLRRRNEILSAQMGVVEVFAATLGLKRNDGAMTPDIVWSIQRALDEPMPAGDAEPT